MQQQHQHQQQTPDYCNISVSVDSTNSCVNPNTNLNNSEAAAAFTSYHPAPPNDNPATSEMSDFLPPPQSSSSSSSYMSSSISPPPSDINLQPRKKRNFRNLRLMASNSVSTPSLNSISDTLSNVSGDNIFLTTGSTATSLPSSSRLSSGRPALSRLSSGTNSSSATSSSFHAALPTSSSSSSNSTTPSAFSSTHVPFSASTAHFASDLKRSTTMSGSLQMDGPLDVSRLMVDQHEPTALTARLGMLTLDPKKNLRDLSPHDLEMLGELGHGNGGSVHLVRHRPTGVLMAKKALFMDPSSMSSSIAMVSTMGFASSAIDSPETEIIQRRIVRELQILHSCESPYIISFHGAFVHDGEISICIEHMDLGSLDRVYRTMAPVDEPVLAQIALAVLEGLVYLYMNYRIIHRDVKPSNILFNSLGQFKICDFGVSGEAINSVVKTFVGTSAYMSPERIKGQPYSVQSDIWSLGLTLCEVAMGRYPFPPDGEERNLAIFELLDFIVNEEGPSLPPGKYSDVFNQFLALCLLKNPDNRPTPSSLMLHPFILHAKAQPADLVCWAREFKQRQARNKEQQSCPIPMT